MFSGNSRLCFDQASALAQGKTKIEYLTVSQAYDRFLLHSPDKHCKSERVYGSRLRLQSKKLRCYNEDLSCVHHNYIQTMSTVAKDTLYQLTTVKGSSVAMTIGQRCLTNRGWLALGEICPNLRNEIGAVSGSGNISLRRITLNKENTLLEVHPDLIIRVVCIGQATAFGLEGSGPWHNFCIENLLFC